MPNVADPLVVCFLGPLMLLLHMFLDRTAKDVIQGGVVSYDSSKLLFNIVILKDREKDQELVVSTMAKHLLQSKKGFLLLMFVRGKVGVDREDKLSIQ